MNQKLIESFAQEGSNEFKDIKGSVRDLENEKNILRQSDNSPIVKKPKEGNLTPECKSPSSNKNAKLSTERRRSVLKKQNKITISQINDSTPHKSGEANWNQDIYS